jgi:hypothetical protein
MLRVGIAFALSDAAETLIIAGLIERYFGAQSTSIGYAMSLACSRQR